MVALGASAMSATPPIPIFSGPVITSIKGAVNHHDGRINNVDVVMWIMNVWSHAFWGWSFGSPLESPKNIVTKKVYMRTSTSSGNDIFGARENMTKRRT
jgi:hypothetical protein